MIFKPICLWQLIKTQFKSCCQEIEIYFLSSLLTILHILKAVYVPVTANVIICCSISSSFFLPRSIVHHIELLCVRKKQQRSITEKTHPGQTLDAIKTLIALRTLLARAQ